MFENSLFTSEFWEWYIIILTLGGIAGCFALIIWMSSDRPKPDKKVETMGHVWDESLEEYNNPLPKWWLYMFYITLYFGIIYLILYPGLGSFAGLLKENQLTEYEAEVKAAETRYAPIYAKYQNQPIETLVKNEDAVKIGHRLFMNYCTICHGSDAGGAPGFPNLRDDDWLYGGEPAAIKTSIMNGRNGMMPTAEANGLSSEEKIHQTTHYVLSLSGQEHDKAAAEKGQQIYMGICLACHGVDGTGMTALGAPNLTDNIWLYGGSEAKIKETLTHGRQGKMPAHGEFLGEAKVHLLATYIYSLSMNQEK
jgi:cytochrome c oxidase cbb3-type subunit 3